MASSIGFRILSCLPSCYSSYGAWTLTPVGLAPTDHASLRWTHTSRYRSLLGEDSAPLASVPQSLGLCFLECSYDLPMRIPVTNTSAPPSPTCIAAENTGVSMNRCRTHV